jgi:hypothetical protein
VKIPVSVVPRARVDFDAEARQILGFPLQLHADGHLNLAVPPLTAARLVALELVTSQFFLHPDSCDPQDVAIALTILTAPRVLIPRLTADQAFLDARASDLLRIYASEIAARYNELVAWIRTVPFYGFLMGPDGKPPEGEMWFDGAFVGATVAPAARILSMPVDRVLWETPLCLVGHAVVQHAAALGAKGVERPPDRAALKRIMDDAAARELAGQLHPWQYADPVCYPLTDTQAQANPALIELFARIRAEYDRTHRPVDPDRFPVPPPASAGESERTFAVQEPPVSASEAERTSEVQEPPAFAYSINRSANDSGRTMTVEAPPYE